MTPIAALVPLGVTTTAASAVLFAQSATAGSDAGTVLSGGVLAAAVGALVFLVRQFGNGKLVARDPATIENKLIEALDRVTAALEESGRREDDYLDLLKAPRVDRRRDDG